MDHDERDPRDWPESDRAGEPPAEPTEETPQAPTVPPSEPRTDAPSEAPAEPAAPIEPDWSAAQPSTSEPASAEMESWPSQEAETASSTGPQAADDRPWPTEPPEAGGAEAGTWPTSAPERSDEPAWSGETPPAPPPPAEAEAATPTDEAAWPAEPAPPGSAAAAAEPPPSEAEAYPTAAAASVAAAGAAAPSVPDAEAATGESTQCPRCGTENRPGLAFCRNCGQRLVAAGVATTVERPGTPEGTMACPRCGTHNRAGVAFCQNCGANLRGTAPGYVPPAVAGAATAEPVEVERGGAVLGPVVLLIGLVGLVTGYMLPFVDGDDSLYERAFGPGGYGIQFWTAYPSDATLTDTIYFGLAAPVPILGALLALLTLAGFVRARPRSLQVLGLVIALAWSAGLIVLFLIVEVFANWGGDIVGVLRELSPGGIILFLASLIVLIGTLTRFGRS